MGLQISRIPSAALGTSVSTLCLGGIQFGWTAGRNDTFRLLDAFAEADGNLVDTADSYSRWVRGHVGGESERLIGEWMHERGRRHNFLVATKAGFESELGEGLGRTHLLRSAESSLRNLRVDCIPIFQLHRPDPETPVEETALALAELQDRRLIRAVGFSNMGTAELGSYLTAARAAGVRNLFGYQGKFNYLERDRVSSELMSLLRSQGLIFLAYGILARGFLTGKYSGAFDEALSMRARSVGARYGGEQNSRRLAAFLREAGPSGHAPSRAAFEWARGALGAHGVPVILIGGFTCVQQLREATGIQPRLTGAALANYLNYRNAECVGGDPAYRPLLESLRRRHPDAGQTPAAFARLPVLTAGTPAPGEPPPLAARLLVMDVLSAATGIRRWPAHGLLTEQQRRTLAIVARTYRKRLYSLLDLGSLQAEASTEHLYALYAKLRAYLSDLGSPIAGLARVAAELDAAARFYSAARPSAHWLVYQDFPAGSLETLVQPEVDCCLFNGQSRHRAATVAFLNHPAVRLSALYCTATRAAVGATIEADMEDEAGRPVHVLDSVEIGDARRRLGLRYGWKALVALGVIRRCLETSRCRTVLFNTGYDEAHALGYLSHEAAVEFADWLKHKLPVVRLRLRIQGGLDPLRRLGAVNPLLNLEVLSTKHLNNMFNEGHGEGGGVLIDLDDTDQLSRLGLEFFAEVAPTRVL